MSRGLGGTQKKVLLLLSAGIGLGFSRSAKTHLKVIESTVEEWKKINYHSLRRAIRSLYTSKLVSWLERSDGLVELTLTDKGKSKVLTYNPNFIELVKPRKWDNKWRVIVFDIPEKRRKVRDALRGHLRQLGFYELQKSVFVHPYPCNDIFDFLVELYNIRKHVRFILAEDLDNSLDLRDRFDLL
ncbi:MAG: CRISPR-associated endonuclease Cas2 [Patescibacteria group bacterium]